MLRLILANKNYSSWSLRPWLVLRATGLPFEEQVIPLDVPGYEAAIAAASPSRRLPVLDDDGLLVWDSLAIAEYLNEKAPEAKLWPEDPRARAHARAVSCEMHSGFTAMRGEMPMNLKRTKVPLRPSDACTADVRRVGEIFTTYRKRHAGDGEYLFGRWSIADAMFAPVATRLRTYGVYFEGVAQDYVETLLAHPGFVAWERAALEETWAITRYDAIG